MKDTKKKLAFGMISEKKPTAWIWNFEKLQGWVAKEYEAKGKSKEDAERIWGAIAAKIWMAKYWKKAMAKASVKGRTM